MLAPAPEHDGIVVLLQLGWDGAAACGDLLLGKDGTLTTLEYHRVFGQLRLGHLTVDQNSAADQHTCQQNGND